ncbi:SLAM family member 7-like isoform X2 [Oenanthe melanoleuca]|uniref:SLAM family member 7-like isoform X2 n=1 Tax=Oenanthe melanoleuca TaxID=2939378 RepID=UPI0024C11716|nr:SLAM family member 7-like isoform X2 [Oenanthe melanoleuca]
MLLFLLFVVIIFCLVQCPGSSPFPQMPMDEFWIPLLTTLILLHQTTSASDTPELIRAVGGSVTFHIQDTSGGDAAIWIFGNVPIVTVSFKNPSKHIFTNDKFEKRFAVSKDGRALSISQLTLEDAGNYSVIIGEKRSTFPLHVYRELAEPTVTCEAQNCSSDGSCHFSLRCSVSGTDLGKISYIWRVGDQPRDEGRMVVLVNKSSLEEPEPLTCMARNPVSIRNVTVTTPDMLCTESSTHPPGLGTLSSTGVTIWLIATIGVAVLFLVLLLFLRKFTGWRKFRLSKPKPTDTEVSPNTVYAEVGPSQQCIPNGIKAKPTNGELPSTIYSLVKRPDQVENGTAENGTVTGLELV